MKFCRDFLKIGKKCVLADIHFGLLKLVDRELVEKISRLASEYEEVIVAGDLKHLGKKFNFKLSSNVLLVKGNHDAKINAEKIVFVKKFAIFHGHFIPREALDYKKWITGHIHPAIYLNETKEKVFLLGKNKEREILVLPAFNELCSSTAVNIRKPDSKIFKNFSEWFVISDNLFLDLESLTTSSSFSF
ncbi:MAG: hypothetical protein NZ895_03555 [Archaeoglobaceae archaeon]|nr:hypothetical protein [Archaeoglobaceae archaeon]MCX8152385.1 hypothetical protein [Archaeoglobaceae archaeon]MDW8013725.1 hypothetical protein [Archaeoglobaceae archaeon]